MLPLDSEFHLLVHRERVETLRRAFAGGAGKKKRGRWIGVASAPTRFEGQRYPDKGIPLPTSEDGAFT
jgi:hypothetical protein